MAGASGTGKSMTANILANELSSKSTVRIKYSDINTADPRSCAEQLFGSYIKNTVFKDNVSCNTRCTAQLIRNPEIVVLIDEFDKFMMRDDSLQAMLWDISDTGYLKVSNDTPIDCSKTIFILTSNASKESLKIGFNKTKDTDNSNSLESVNFKQAFLNRITSVYFENFSQETYKAILLERLKPIKEYYSKNYGIMFNLSDDSLSDISKRLSETQAGGARNVGIFVSKLYNTISRFRRENNISKLNEKNKKLESAHKDSYNLDILYKEGRFEIKNKN